MIAVAVLADSAARRARLDALLAGHPRIRLVTAGPISHADPQAPRVDAEVIVLDPGTRPLEAALRELGGGARLPPVMALAAGAPPAALPRLLRAGVRAILPRDTSAIELAAAVEAVAAGLVVLHPSAPPAMLGRPTTRAGEVDARTDPLTPRELEILGMMAEGLGNRAIARSLGISTHTVKFHVAAVLAKLGARSRAEAVAVGLRRGLLMV